MKLVNLIINNFRGVKHCDLIFPTQAVLVGDNNTGKSTILEAIDLVLGPERLSRKPVIDEHDFYAGQYLDAENNPIEINIEAIVTDFDPEQQIHFMNNIEWWDTNTQALLHGPPPEATDGNGVVPSLRLGFRGYYDAEEDDFAGETFFLSPELDEGKHDPLRLKDKRMCGFLYLRTLRTGSRALSLERGSLLDIILKLRELKPRIWEDVLTQLRDVSVANDAELGISDILTTVQKAIRELVPVECADAPAIRVSQMTREHLRQILTVFLGTGTCDENGKEKPKTIPKELPATALISSALETLNLLRLGASIISASFFVSIARISSGVEQFIRSSDDVSPKMSVKMFSYSGNTWSSKAITLRLRSEVIFTMKNLARHNSRSS